MTTLLSEAIEAHGGIERWQVLTEVQATLVSGGDLFAIKGLPQDQLRVADGPRAGGLLPGGTTSTCGLAERHQRPAAAVRPEPDIEACQICHPKTGLMGA
ncbi:hypothetical protein [Streptomyces sp. NPDC005181]|uniref:hypothetical protein n=1 Tax=Streptomyces sp. NPDC005181 TaxID=3156869 RepID=UPI0033B252E0